jgi:hypothetical protein
MVHKYHNGIVEKIIPEVMQPILHHMLYQQKLQNKLGVSQGEL